MTSDDGGLARTAAGAIGWSLLNTAASRLGTLAVGIALARLLGPDEFGTFAVAMVALLAVLSFNELGVSLAVVRWERDPEAILATVNTISTVGSLMLFAALFACAPPLAATLGAPEAAGIIQLMSVSIVFSGIVAGPAALLQRQFRQRRRMVIDQVVTWTGTFLSLGLALGGHGAWSLAWGRVIATLVGVLLFVHATRPYRWHLDRALVRPLMRFGLPLAGASIVVFAVGYVQQVVVGAQLGATALGYFVLAFNLASWPLTMFSQPLRSVAPAVFARLQGDPGRIKESFTMLLRGVAVVALPVCVVGAAAAPDVVRFVYGASWAPAGDAFRVLVLAAAVKIFLELAYDLLVVLRRTGQLLAVQLAWLLVLVPAAWLGVRTSGLIGAALAELLVVMIVVLPLYLGMLAMAGIAPGPLVRAVLPTAAVAAMAAAAALLLARGTDSAVVGAVAGGVLCVLAVATGAALHPTQLRQLRQLRHPTPDAEAVSA